MILYLYSLIRYLLYHSNVLKVFNHIIIDVVTMRKAFKTYEQIINNLIFDGQSIVLNTTKNLVYVKKINTAHEGLI